MKIYSQHCLKEIIQQRTLSAITARRWVIGGEIVRPTKLSCGTQFCNTLQGLRKSKKLKHRALSLYMGNGMRTAVEAIGSFNLILPSGLIIVLDNCHFAPTVTRGVVSISRLVENGYSHTFTNYGISVSKDNMVSERRNRTLLDMVRSMMNLTTLPKSFWGYALESAARILNMVPTKKVERTPYEIWHGKAPKLPKGNNGLLLLLSTKNKIFVARNAEFFENSLIVQEASGSHGLLKMSGSEKVGVIKDLE
ncbi:retrotransposon protein, putative, ty1-copia subclass [Tanacetum coccineum]